MEYLLNLMNQNIGFNIVFFDTVKSKFIRGFFFLKIILMEIVCNKTKK